MRNQRGVILISTFIIMITLTVVAAGFLYMNSIQNVAMGSDIISSKAFWLAQAGLQKAIWNLKTPTGSGGQGENWNTDVTGTIIENLGDGSYTMACVPYDFSLSSNGAIASDDPVQTDSSIAPAKAIDNDVSTYWESLDEPKNNSPQDIIINFPYPLTINKVRFLSPSSGARPRDYTWEVSSDGTTYTIVVTVNNNTATDVTDTFTAQSNVNYLRLRTTKDGQGDPKRVGVATLEVIGSKITSTGTVSSFNRKIEQTVVADESSPQSQVAYNEIDWNEI